MTWGIIESIATIIGAAATIVGVAIAIWKRLLLRANLSIETRDPVYWSELGCPIEIQVTVHSGNIAKYKVVVFQKNTKEDTTTWHFQFESLITAKKQTIKGFIWHGTASEGDQEYQEVLAAIVPKEQTPRRHPAVCRLEDYKLKSIVTKTVFRDDKAVSPIRK